MKKKKRTSKEHSYLWLIALILGIITFYAIIQLNQKSVIENIDNCRYISDVIASLDDEHHANWHQSESGDYLVYEYTNSDGHRSASIYTVDTCAQHDIELNNGTLSHWSPDESYVVFTWHLPGSSGCRSIDIFTGDGHQAIFRSEGCVFDFGSNYGFLEWRSDHELTLYTTDAGSSQVYHAIILDNQLEMEAVASPYGN